MPFKSSKIWPNNKRDGYHPLIPYSYRERLRNVMNRRIIPGPDGHLYWDTADKYIRFAKRSLPVKDAYWYAMGGHHNRRKRLTRDPEVCTDDRCINPDHFYSIYDKRSTQEPHGNIGNTHRADSVRKKATVPPEVHDKNSKTTKPPKK